MNYVKRDFKKVYGLILAKKKISPFSLSFDAQKCLHAVVNHMQIFAYNYILADMHLHLIMELNVYINIIVSNTKQ